MNMDLNFLSKFKNQLVGLKRALESRIKKLYKSPEFGNDVDAGDEEASESEEFGKQMAIAQKYKEQLADVDTALKKIDKKKYGICERCGMLISEDVLKVAPQSRLCKECKKKASGN